MRSTMLILLVILALVGCNSLPKPAQSSPSPDVDAVAPLYHGGYSPSQHNVQLSNYVEQLVIALQQNGAKNLSGTIIVSSFVDLDNSLRNTNVVGNQLAENFITQLRRFGYGVSDNKLTKLVSITAQGDLVFTRQAKNLKPNNAVCCVLAGTMIYTPKGIEVNTRIINVTDQTVVSSAGTTIPYFVVQHLGIPQ